MKFSKKDKLIAPLSVILISVLTFFSSYLLYSPFLHKKEPLIVCISFFFFLVSLSIFWIFYTLVYLKLLRKSAPLKEGKFDLNQTSSTWVWKLQSFFYIFNLGLFHNAMILPVNLRGLFYKLLGAKIGKYVMIGGKIIEPSMVEIGDYTQVGEDAIISGHIVIRDQLQIAKVLIGKNVTVGGKAAVFPGVCIKDNAVIGVGAVVKMGTVIGESEVWVGNPARKVPQIKKDRNSAVS